MISVSGVQTIGVLARGSTYVGLSCDRLASVGVGAVLRIEAFGALGERDELIPRVVEILDVSVEILEMSLEELDDVVARTFPNAPKVENGCDLCEGQACCLSIANEPQPQHRIIVVVAVAVVRPLRFREEPYVLVVADRLGWHICSFTEFSDFHDGSIHEECP